MTELQKEREERKLTTLLYIGSVVVMLLLLYATYTNIKQYGESVRKVRAHNQALIELEGSLSSLRDAETGVRGYQLTNDTTFLQPYEQANRRLKDHLAHLRSGLNADDSLRLLELRERAMGIQGVWRSMVFNNGNTFVSRPSLAYDLREAKALMDTLRVVHEKLMADRIQEREKLLEEERSDGVDAPFMLVIYSLLTIVATSILFWRLARTLRRNEEVRLALRMKLKDLDREVSQRASLQMRLQKVLDVSPSSIMSFRAIRDESNSIIDFEWLSSNTKANSTVGRDDLVGKRLLEEMPENRASGLFDAYVEVVGNDIPFVKEFHYTGSGLDAWFRNHAVKLEDGFMVTFSDITDQKRAEQINMESDRLELTAQITRTVAHEVRNPLTNIHLAVEQVQDEVGDKKDLVDPYFAIIDRNLKRIGTLIKEMLESSRKRELKLIPCKMDDIVNNALKAVTDRLSLKGMMSVVDIAPQLPEVMADCELINLAIINIAVNAVEAMEQGKGKLEFSVTRQPDAVVMEIADNGKGIPPENLQRLFEPFYSGRPGGLGLGLTTSRSILHSHGVQLDVRSKLGTGTTFSLRFPERIFVPGT
ncbi:MAG: CHASE3 domain-containing protein [Flavobacteriales bacterium]|nr:CHASE3 domain-containing protein [Flavobacteriales bacterium]